MFDVEPCPLISKEVLRFLSLLWHLRCCQESPEFFFFFFLRPELHSSITRSLKPVFVWGAHDVKNNCCDWSVRPFRPCYLIAVKVLSEVLFLYETHLRNFRGRRNLGLNCLFGFRCFLNKLSPLIKSIKFSSIQQWKGPRWFRWNILHLKVNIPLYLASLADQKENPEKGL